eukprot:554459-Pleurochrysis_carterae.AAC.3
MLTARWNYANLSKSEPPPKSAKERALGHVQLAQAGTTVFGIHLQNEKCAPSRLPMVHTYTTSVTASPVSPLRAYHLLHHQLICEAVLGGKSMRSITANEGLGYGYRHMKHQSSSTAPSKNARLLESWVLCWPSSVTICHRESAGEQRR